MNDMFPYLGVGFIAVLLIGFAMFMANQEHQEKMLKMKLSAQTQTTTQPAESR